MAEDISPGRWLKRSATLFQTFEHGAYMVLGVLLSATALLALAGAAFSLVSGLSDWSDEQDTFIVIDRLLFALMLIEILHTVRASMRSGTLNSEPFLVVALISSIRRVLVITLKSSEGTKDDPASAASQILFRSSMLELGVLGVLILVMVFSIWLLRRPSPAASRGTPPS